MGIAPGQPLSEFGHAALTLDEEMRRFEHLGRELSNLTIESDKGMSRGKEILTELSSCRERLERRMREMAQSLEEVRARNEKTEEIIASRTEIWQKRQTEVERLLERFRLLGNSVHLLNGTVAEIRERFGKNITPEQQEHLRNQLNKATEPLTMLVEEAKNLVQDARAANMKGLERDADSLRQTLQAARNRLNLIAERRAHLSG